MATDTIFATLSFNGLIALLALAIFEFLRLREVDIYSPRSRADPRHLQPDRKLFGWIPQVLALSDEQMMRLAGLDGYIFLRFLLMCSKICGICSVGALALMLCYGTAPRNEKISGIDVYSLANVEPRGDRLWGAFAGLYVFTAVFLYFIDEEYRNFVVVRWKYFSTRDQSDSLLPMQTRFTVMVESIPPAYRSSEKLHQLFEKLFPGEVLFAYVAVSMDNLDKAVAERNELTYKYEVAVAQAKANPRKKRPTLYLLNGRYFPNLMVNSCPSYCCCCLPYWNRCCNRGTIEEVDSITFLSDQLAYLAGVISELQLKAQAATLDISDESLRESSYDIFRQLLGKANSLMNDSDKVQGPSEGADATTREGVISQSPADSTVEESQSIEETKGNHKKGTVRNLLQRGLSLGSSSRGSSRRSKDDRIELGNVISDKVTGAVTGMMQAAWTSVKAGGSRVREINSTILDLKNTLAEELSSATGFVTFRTRRTQLCTAQIPILCHEYPRMTAIAAPPPSDIIWANASFPPSYTENASYFTAAFYYTGLIFWSTVLAFVAALSKLQNLEVYIPALKSLNSTAYAIMQGLLPVFVMMAFTWLIPFTMNYTSTNIERQKTNSAVQMQVFRWYFLYQLANVYLFLLAGSIWSLLSKAIENPYSILQLIGTVLPTVSIFFINFIITTWLGGVPMMLLQPFPTLSIFYYRDWSDKLRVTRNMLMNGPLASVEMDYGTVLPDNLYVLIVVLLYWVIAPVLLFFSAGFFFSTYLVYKYLYAFVVVRSYESGGQYWYNLYSYSMIGLMSSTITAITYMGIKEGVLQTPALAPLPFIIIYCWRRTESKYRALSMNVPWDYATTEDVGVFADGEGSSQSNPLLTSSNAVESECNEGDLEKNSENKQSIATAHLLLTHDDILQSFTQDFIKQPNVVEGADAKPYPHRIRGIPLFNSKGQLNSEYWNDDPEISSVTDEEEKAQRK